MRYILSILSFAIREVIKQSGSNQLKIHIFKSLFLDFFEYLVTFYNCCRIHKINRDHSTCCVLKSGLKWTTMKNLKISRKHFVV